MGPLKQDFFKSRPKQEIKKIFKVTRDVQYGIYIAQTCGLFQCELYLQVKEPF